MKHQEPSTSAKLSWRGRLLLLSFGFLLVLMLELILRAFGFGGRAELFQVLLESKREQQSVRLMRTNPSALEIFFSKPMDNGTLRSGSMEEERFFMPKPDNVYRVAYVGESTVEGFPFPPNLASASFLETMLNDLPSDKTAEVINLGVTAAASFPIRKVAEESLEQIDPDLLVIYMGHNEFYGASGVASFQSMGSSVSSMKVSFVARQLGLFGALQSGVRGLKPKSGKGDTDKQLIQVMAAEDFVPPKSHLHLKAEKTLSANLKAMIHASMGLDVPVIVCTPASNLRGMAPMSSDDRRLSEEQRSFLSALKAPDNYTTRSLILKRLQSIVQEAPESSLASFRLAQFIEEIDSAQAVDLYTRARDLDAMPWRASTGKIDVIRMTAEENGAFVADVVKTFSENSQEGKPPGWDLFDDHVHPSLKGQALIALCILEQVVENKLIPMKKGVESTVDYSEWGVYAPKVAAHPFDRLRVLNMMVSLFEEPPLRSNNDEAYEDLTRRYREVLSTLDETESRAVAHWLQGSQASGKSVPICYFAATAYLQDNRFEEGVAAARSSVLNAPEFSDHRLAAKLIELLALLGDGKAGSGVITSRFESLKEEVGFISLLPEQPSAITHYVAACLFYLIGDEDQFGARMILVEEKMATLDSHGKAILGELPPPNGLSAVLDQYVQSYLEENQTWSDLLFPED